MVKCVLVLISYSSPSSTVKGHMFLFWCRQMSLPWCFSLTCLEWGFFYSERKNFMFGLWSVNVKKVTFCNRLVFLRAMQKNKIQLRFKCFEGCAPAPWKTKWACLWEQLINPITSLQLLISLPVCIRANSPISRLLFFWIFYQRWDQGGWCFFSFLLIV